MSLRGYLPPDGAQNIHEVPHNYRESQGAHKLGQSVIESPESVILTADEYAHREAEQHGLERVSDDVAQAALEAHREGGDVEAVIDGADSHTTADTANATDDTDDDLDDSEAGEWLTEFDGIGQAKADALEDAGYADYDRVAKATIEDLAAVDSVSESDAETIKNAIGE